MNGKTPPRVTIILFRNLCMHKNNTIKITGTAISIEAATRANCVSFILLGEEMRLLPFACLDPRLPKVDYRRCQSGPSAIILALMFRSFFFSFLSNSGFSAAMFVS